ncbi:MAG: TIGR03905 family TSCPD domain-containing protein [Acidaminococcaceae bacterium]
MYHYRPENVCSQSIDFEIQDGKVHNLTFTAGCPGNLKAISVLVEGMPVAEVIAKLSGITCGSRGTSCADQLCKALAAHH